MAASIRLKDLYRLGKEIDIGAEGHYARVYQGKSMLHNRLVAFKIMRHDYLESRTVPNGEPRLHDREWLAFSTEVRALKQFAEHPMVTDFIDCGFINTDVDIDPDYPEPDDELISLGVDVETFLDLLPEQRARKWRPYIVTEYVDRRSGTVFIGKRFPVHVVLEIISQFVDLLIYVQDRGYIYGDHKLDHTYWVFQDGKLKVIDWNGGKFINEVKEFTPEQLKKADIRDLVIYVMYGLLTGQHLNVQGVRPDGGRAESITEVDLPADLAGHDVLQKFLNQVCQKEIRDAEHMRVRLDEIMIEYGMERPGKDAPPETYITGKNEVISIVKQLDLTLGDLEAIKQRAYLSIANTVDYPSHIRAEFETIIRSIERVLESNDLFTKIDSML